MKTYYFLIKKIFFNKKRVIKIFFILFFSLREFYSFLLKIKIKNNCRENFLYKGRNFLNICLNGFLYNYKKYINYPKISVIIPIYNSQNSIKFCISSIQKQKLKNFEIILVNDFSKDKSKIIIKKMQIKDTRIKTINNNKRMGTLYTRNIGVLLSKGKFIFPIDNDDMFFDNDVFKIIYEKAKINDYDIVGFKAIRGHSYNAKIIEMYDDKFHMHKSNLLVKQPKLRLFSISNMECHIWGKCIKNRIYKKAVNVLGIKRYSFNICIAEDDTMVFILFNIANSFKFVSKYGIFHLISKNTAFFSLPKTHVFFCRMYFINILYDFTKNNYKDKKYVVNYVLNLRKNKIFKKFLNFKNRKYLKLLLKKIINCSFITKFDKIKIINIYKIFL